MTPIAVALVGLLLAESLDPADARACVAATIAACEDATHAGETTMESTIGRRASRARSTALTLESGANRIRPYRVMDDGHFVVDATGTDAGRYPHVPPAGGVGLTLNRKLD